MYRPARDPRVPRPACTASWRGALSELTPQLAQLEPDQPTQLLAALLELVGDPIEVGAGALVTREQALPSGVKLLELVLGVDVELRFDPEDGSQDGGVADPGLRLGHVLDDRGAPLEAE